MSLFQVQKSDRPQAACEDVGIIAPEHGLAVLCDGASTSAFARHWASILADAFVFDLGSELGCVGSGEIRDWLAECRGRFADATFSQDWPWHAIANLEAGAYATLLGVRIDESGLSALAIGDSCLFWDVDGRLCSFPWIRYEDLAVPPVLVGSDPRSDVANPHRLGPVSPPPHLTYLVSDALAAPCLTNVDRWHDLRSCSEAGAFETLVRAWREKRWMPDDDATMIRIEACSEGSQW